jgi:hypothetical protein
MWWRQWRVVAAAVVGGRRGGSGVGGSQGGGAGGGWWRAMVKAAAAGGCHTRFYKENRMHLTCASGSIYTHMIDKKSVIPLQR